MKRSASFIILLIIKVVVCAAQKPVTDAIEKAVTATDAKGHLEFLASDELRGRDTGSQELKIAGKYIATYFERLGLKPAVNGESYLQPVPLQNVSPPSTVDLTIGEQTLTLGKEVLLLSGGNAHINSGVVFVGYGSREEMEKAAVKGKIVVAYMGTADDNNINHALLSTSPEKSKRAIELGALALVEIIHTPGNYFKALSNYLSNDRMVLMDEDANMPHLWMKDIDSVTTMLKEKKGMTGSLKAEGINTTAIDTDNVAAILEGTDPALKKEYIVVSAHYDHIGVGEINEAQDSIFNGARDNAIGVVGMMMTAKYLSQNRPKRSLLFLALTAEEKGLYGSAWYASHPLVPLKQTVFNFNCDGAGYNDTSIVTVIGLERTSAESTIAKACNAFGLKAATDPAPEEHLYERSDNYNFAEQGVPAIDFAPGIKAFDQEIMKYYHQQEDEVNTLDFNYVIKFLRAYVYANYLLANTHQPPFWTAGDEYESAGKKLFGK